VRTENMFSVQNHFADTNIIIAHTVDWDTHHHSGTKYCNKISEENCILNTSYKVCEEARTVIQKYKRYALKSLKMISEDFEGGPPYNLQNDIRNFLFSKFKERLDEDDFRRIVNHLLQYWFSPKSDIDIHDLIYGRGDINKARRTINQDFEEPLIIVSSIKNDKTSICFHGGLPENYRDVYDSIFYEFDDIIDHWKDRDIALDAYHIKNENDFSEIVLASMDDDITSQKENIESLVSSFYVLNVLEL